MIGPNIISVASCSDDIDVQKSTVQKSKRKLNGGISSLKGSKKSRLNKHNINVIEKNCNNNDNNMVRCDNIHNIQLFEYNNTFEQEDCEPKEVENSNLSWLLDFKVASLFDPAEDGNSSRRSSSEEDPREGIYIKIHD